MRKRTVPFCLKVGWDNVNPPKIERQKGSLKQAAFFYAKNKVHWKRGPISTIKNKRAESVMETLL